jgi:hypothetical protein
MTNFIFFPKKKKKKKKKKTTTTTTKLALGLSTNLAPYWKWKMNNQRTLMRQSFLASQQVYKLRNLGSL